MSLNFSFPSHIYHLFLSMDSIGSYPVACGNLMFDILLSKNHHLIIPLTKERTLTLFSSNFLIFFRLDSSRIRHWTPGRRH